LQEDAFRAWIAQSAIAARARLGDQLLAVFSASNDHLDQVLATLRPQDWETLCHHPMGPEPVRTFIDMRITELAMHGWDMRSRFDPQATLAPDSVPALLTTIPRAVRRAFRPDASRTTPVRYRFALTGPDATVQDIVLSPEGGRCEPASAGQADVTFRCAAETYVLVLFGRLAVDTALRDGRLSYEGDPELVAAFGQAFVGG
jgi:SCP-2 sterol transfer family protein/mycothiol maleylpyruvate isomerase-like protein